ncbi:hypothetical protein [Nonomuraea salmonea]|uniref:Uncharacterized protein n=1 Tax=Nonomuraea salmonea TaxID=46181 RepID=A0ABV5P4V2_9ACTN
MQMKTVAIPGRYCNYERVTVANPLNLRLCDGSHFEPRHEIVEYAKYERLVDDMSERGWSGPPIVADVEACRAVTGSHRIPAAHSAGITAPAVDLADLTEKCGVDLQKFVARYGELEFALPALCDRLPSRITDAYGLDIY